MKHRSTHRIPTLKRRSDTGRTYAYFDREQVTFGPSFDGFPMFSRDGKKLVFASNRNNSSRGETNLFLADWVD